MDTETYSGIMNVKYSPQKKISSELRMRSNLLHKPVDKNVLFYSYFPCKVQKENSREEKNILKKKIFQKKLRYRAKYNAWT